MVGEIVGSLIFGRAGSWISGALHAKGSSVSTPVGNTTNKRPFAPITISILHGGNSVSLFHTKHPFLLDLGESFLGEWHGIGSDK